MQSSLNPISTLAELLIRNMQKQCFTFLMCKCKLFLYFPWSKKDLISILSAPAGHTCKKCQPVWSLKFGESIWRKVFQRFQVFPHPSLRHCHQGEENVHQYKPDSLLNLFESIENGRLILKSPEHDNRVCRGRHFKALSVSSPKARMKMPAKREITLPAFM